MKSGLLNIRGAVINDIELVIKSGFRNNKLGEINREKWVVENTHPFWVGLIDDRCGVRIGLKYA